MSLRAPRETLDSLRITLQNLEQSTGETSDASAVAELKRILLRRMGDLEAAEALAAGATAQPTLADATPLEAVMNEEATHDAPNVPPARLRIRKQLPDLPPYSRTI